MLVFFDARRGFILMQIEFHSLGICKNHFWILFMIEIYVYIIRMTQIRLFDAWNSNNSKLMSKNNSNTNMQITQNII